MKHIKPEAILKCLATSPSAVAIEATRIIVDERADFQTPFGELSVGDVLSIWSIRVASAEKAHVKIVGWSELRHSLSLLNASSTVLIAHFESSSHLVSVFLSDAGDLVYGTLILDTPSRNRPPPPLGWDGGKLD